MRTAPRLYDGCMVSCHPKDYIIDIWEEIICRLFDNNARAHQPCPHSPTGDLAGVKGQNSNGFVSGR